MSRPLSVVTGPYCMILKAWGCTDNRGLALMELDIASEASDCFEVAVC